MTKVKNRELKKRARIALTDQHSFFALVTVIVIMADVLLANIVNYVFPSTGNLLNFILYWACSILTNMVYYLVLAGAMGLYLNLCRDRQCRIGDLWSAFSYRPEQVAVYSVLQFALQTVTVWTITVQLSAPGSTESIAALLLSIVLIVIQLGLSMVLFIYCDDRSKSAWEMIKESWRMMRGNKLRLFTLNLSFIGVLLLCVLSLGIGLLFVRPYIYVSQALFYLNIKQDAA